MNSAKRKQKDAKNREIFEKCFPEIKKIREEKDGGKGDDGHGASHFTFNVDLIWKIFINYLLSYTESKFLDVHLKKSS